jgi:hypothetical protein
MWKKEGRDENSLGAGITNGSEKLERGTRLLCNITLPDVSRRFGIENATL